MFSSLLELISRIGIIKIQLKPNPSCVHLLFLCFNNSLLVMRHLKSQYLGLVVGHLLYQRLTSKLLGATSEVLGGVGRVWCHDGRPSSCSRMHHCRCARWVMLVWPLLWHVGYCKQYQQKKSMKWVYSLKSLQTERRSWKTNKTKQFYTDRIS